MHLQDIFGTMLLIGFAAILVGLCAKAAKLEWFKDSLQIGGVILVVALISLGFAPTKPESAETKAWKAQREAEKAAEKAKEQSHRDMITAMSACDYAIQRNLNYPGSFSGTMFSSSNQQFETADGWEIFRAFEAKNGFGGSLPHVGHCSIRRGGGISVEISRG